MANNIALRCWFMIGQINDPARSRLGHGGNDNPADIVNMNAVKDLSFAFDDARLTITKRIKGASPNAIDSSGTENFRTKSLLPTGFSNNTRFTTGGCRGNFSVLIADIMRHIRIDRCCRYITAPARKISKISTMRIKHRIRTAYGGNRADDRINIGKGSGRIGKRLA